jgi:hypothetical protein
MLFFFSTVPKKHTPNRSPSFDMIFRFIVVTGKLESQRSVPVRVHTCCFDDHVERYLVAHALKHRFATVDQEDDAIPFSHHFLLQMQKNKTRDLANISCICLVFVIVVANIKVVIPICHTSCKHALTAVSSRFPHQPCDEKSGAYEDEPGSSSNGTPVVCHSDQVRMSSKPQQRRLSHIHTIIIIIIIVRKHCKNDGQSKRRIFVPRAREKRRQKTLLSALCRQHAH